MFWIDLINASTVIFITELNPELLYFTFWFRVI